MTSILSAHDDSSVLRELAIHSCVDSDDERLPLKKPKRSSSSDNLDVSPNQEVLRDAVNAMKKKAQNADVMAAAQLRLAERRDHREELEAKTRLDIEKRKQKVEEMKVQNERYTIALGMMASDNQVVKARGEAIFKELSDAGF